VNCPKCGFVQEERTDCKKCGVIFAKFYSLHAPDSLAAAAAFQEPQQASSEAVKGKPLLEPPPPLEFRQHLHDLQERLSELEFERAERQRFRDDMRALEERLEQSLQQITTRQDEIERRIAELAAPADMPTRQDLADLSTELQAIDLQSIQKRFEHLESKLQLCTEELASRSDGQLVEFLPMMDERLNEVEGRIHDLVGAEGAPLPNGTQAQLDATVKSLEELKTALQNVTVRYSEIGELKKNHLVLQNTIEALQQSMESLGKESTKAAAGKIAELEKEVFALKAEVRKAYERMESLETQGAPVTAPSEATALSEISSLREEVAALGRLRTEERQQIQSELGALQTKVGESLEIVTKLPEKLESFSSQILRLNEQGQPLGQTAGEVPSGGNGDPQKITELGRQATELHAELLQARSQIQALQAQFDNFAAHPLLTASAQAQVDMYAIRENLDEIRRFMTTLSHKS
jgi:predicted  nucleic acid-binding Zn-ribbon protein